MWFILPITILLILVLVPVALVSRSIWYPKYAPRAAPRKFPGVQSPEDCDALATELMSQMSRKEKLKQLSGDLSTARFSFRYGVRWRLKAGIPLIYSGLNKRLGIPPLAFSDGPRGVNVGLNRTCFPVTMARGASFDPSLEEEVGRAMGRELRATGANYSGAVCVNLLRHPGWGRAQETYGEDPYHMGEMGVALTRGIQSQNVMACVKHFALNSIENARFYVDVNCTERTLREVYLPHFKKIVQQGNVASVMSAYNKFRGEYCGHSHYLLTRILREEWGFKGFVTSDWMHGVRDGVAGIKAGMDVEMPARRRYGKPLTDALRDEVLTDADLDPMVHRVLRTRLWYALAPDPQSYDEGLIACPEHIDLARRAAEQSMVLLKNDGVLPLDASRLNRIGVFGALADVENTGDRGSSAVFAPYVVTPLWGLLQRAEKDDIEVDYVQESDPGLVSHVAAEVDVAIVVVGLTHMEEGEWFVVDPDKKADAYRPKFFGGGGDRKDLGLKPEHVELIEHVARAQPNTVVVCMGGSAITMPWRSSVASIVFGFYGGMEGGTALANLLFGDVNPSGKLPFTIPDSQNDLPPFEPFGESADYGPLHGYFLFEEQNLPVAYAFGHGLSYTHFELSHLEVDASREDWRVRVNVENTGTCAGAEVVQVYLAFPKATVSRPSKKLAAFQKVWLAPGEVKQVDVVVEAAERAYFDSEEMIWVVPNEAVEVCVGRASDAVSLRQVVA